MTDFSGIQDAVYFDVAQLSSVVGAGYALRSSISMPEIFEISTPAALMLYFNGSDGSTTFTDSATPPNTVTGAGVTVEISTDYSLSGGSSLFVSGGRLVVPHASWMDGGTDPWTLELFIYEPTVRNYGALASRRNSAVYCPWELRRKGSGEFELYASDSTNTTWSIIQTFDGVTVSAATWTHVALVYTGSAFQIYVAGTKSSTELALATVATSTQDMYIGRGGDNAWIGYMEDVRYTPGEALYTANFTPPTSLL